MVVRHHHHFKYIILLLLYIYYTNNFLGEKRLVRENLCKCLGVPNLKFEIRALLLKSKQKFCGKDPRKIIPLFNERMMTIMIIIIIINCSSYIRMRNVRMVYECVMCERFRDTTKIHGMINVIQDYIMLFYREFIITVSTYKYQLHVEC